MGVPRYVLELDVNFIIGRRLSDGKVDVRLRLEARRDELLRRRRPTSSSLTSRAVIPELSACSATMVVSLNFAVLSLMAVHIPSRWEASSFEMWPRSSSGGREVLGVFPAEGVPEDDSPAAGAMISNCSPVAKVWRSGLSGGILACEFFKGTWWWERQVWTEGIGKDGRAWRRAILVG